MTEGIYLGCDFKSSFRVCGLSQDNLDEIAKNELKGITHSQGSHYKNDAEKILVIPLNESITAGFLESVISASENYTHYEFIISTANDNESFIIEVPEYICKLFKKVGGGINFSYTYTGE